MWMTAELNKTVALLITTFDERVYKYRVLDVNTKQHFVVMEWLLWVNPALSLIAVNLFRSRTSVTQSYHWHTHHSIMYIYMSIIVVPVVAMFSRFTALSATCNRWLLVLPSPVSVSRVPAPQALKAEAPPPGKLRAAEPRFGGRAG